MTATHVISTAGHVDHGKSTLVRALTGTDPDRFAEEKARGLTIDLGFASTTLPSGRTIAIVDVPGHIRFLKNMLAGVGAVDACLFVVAATEGWMQQSEEHLRILELLNTAGGVIALTQMDLVDDDVAELARLDIEEHTVGTFLEGAPIVGVDSLSGAGIPDLLAALDALMDRTPGAADLDRPRLWIDRAFAAKGAGTVVTGTLLGGRVALDDELMLQPAAEAVRVRAIQSLHEQHDSIGPGSRVALNLSGVSHTDVQRGHVLVRKGQWHLTQVFDGSLSVLDTLDHSVSRRGAHVVYIGSGEHPAILRVLGPDAIDPGTSGFVRIRLPRPIPLLPGDRFILRESGRGETIGGGEVLDVDPQMKASLAKPDRSVDRVLIERGWVEVNQLERLTGERRAATLGDWVVMPEALSRSQAELHERIEAEGARGLDIALLGDQERAVVDTLEDVRVEGGRIRMTSIEDTLAEHPFLAELNAAPFSPPKPADADRGEVREMVRRGMVIEEDGIFFSADAVALAAQRIAAMLAGQPDGVTVAEVREELGTSRKYALPILARLDSTGVTRRRDDVRIGGPRLPTADG